MVDYPYSLVSRYTKYISSSPRHLCASMPHKFSLFTVSYAFWRSMSAEYLLLCIPLPGCTCSKKRVMLVAVDVASLNPVWYYLVARRWGALSSIFASTAFSSIFARWERTTMGRMSLRDAISFPLFLERGISLPSLR